MTARDRFLQNVKDALARERPFDTVLALALEHFGADGGTVHVRRGDTLELVAHDAHLPPPLLEKIQSIPIGKGMAGLAAERAAPVSTCDLQTDTSGDVRPGARATGFSGSICVPILDGERVVGTFGIANEREREFDADDQELLLEVARRLAPLASG